MRQPQKKVWIRSALSSGNLKDIHSKSLYAKTWNAMPSTMMELLDISMGHSAKKCLSGGMIAAILYLAIIPFVFFMITPVRDSSAEQSSDYTVFINRKEKTLSIFKDKLVIEKIPCGIGRGGLKPKTSMTDSVTPTGNFIVDIILSNKPGLNAVSDTVKKHYQNTEFAQFDESASGLLKLFHNMNSLDFDKNGKPDNSYGMAYVGLNSDNAVTGPKMRYFNGVPYWFSIAIHGTNDESNVGKANSGGCIHLKRDDLEKMLENGFVKIGTKVVISDSAPDIH